MIRTLRMDLVTGSISSSNSANEISPEMSRRCLIQVALFLVTVLSSAFVVNAGPPLQLDALSGFDEDLDLIPRPGFNSGLLNTVRLPRDVIPLHYDLEIRPILTAGDPDQFKAPGKVVIRIRCDTPTVNITLHAFDMDISANLTTVTSVSPVVDIPVTGLVWNTELQTVTFQLSTNLIPSAEYDLSITFEAKVSDRPELEGLYRSFYLDDAGNQVWLATTQFQKLGARMAFPCFDEPNFRSTFSVTIGRHTQHHSLCNSPLEQTIPIPGMTDWVWDIYGKTVSMSSYLIAIIVSDFDSVTAPAELSKYEVKTWGPPGQTTPASGEFSARAAAQILAFFETYYDSPYQFPKLDSVAIPQFAAGAMENWALNTYRPVLMLWYEGESTQFEQWRQAAVIAHEVCHHWFGDLVTNDWWNDAWLNEGFARYMQFIGANASLTTHGVMDRYTIDTTQLAMDYDAGATTEPVRSNVTDAVTNQASRIIYEKAGALIRMMQGFLTEDTLIKGLRVYLDKYAYSNVVQDQLFEELQAQAVTDGTAAPNTTVKQIMDTWTLKSGFPIVTLRRAGNNVVFISQEPFVPDELRSVKQDPSELWYVPIAYASKQNPDFFSVQPRFWLDKDTLATTKILDAPTDEWIMLNPDARSFFRVMYDTHFFGLILGQLAEDHTVISLSSRSQLIDDYFKSAFAGYVGIGSALDLTKYLHNETENTVWTSVFNNLRQTNRLLLDNPIVHGMFKTHMLSKIVPALGSIGWEQGQLEDTPVTIILRSQLLDWACSFGAPQCDALATNYITELAGTGTPIPADVQPMIYCKAVSMADTLLPGFDAKAHVLQGYRNATRVERHTVFINSIACNAPVEAQIEALLASTIANPSDYTIAHAVQLIQRITENPDNRGYVEFFLQQNMIPIITNLGQKALSDILTSMASYTSEPTWIPRVRARITAALANAGVTDPNVIRALNAANATLDRNAVWMRRYGPSIGTWLEQNLPTP